MWKAVRSGSWDAIGANGRSVDASNMEGLTVADGDIVNFYVDALGGVVQADVIPEPATMTLLGIGSLLLTSIRRKK